MVRLLHPSPRFCPLSPLNDLLYFRKYSFGVTENRSLKMEDLETHSKVETEVLGNAKVINTTQLSFALCMCHKSNSGLLLFLCLLTIGSIGNSNCIFIRQPGVQGWWNWLGPGPN